MFSSCRLGTNIRAPVLGARLAKYYHRVLNRAQWSALAAAQRLLVELIETFAPAGPLIFGIDETVERHWGRRIAARGIYRDAARSSKAVLNKTSGLGAQTLSITMIVPLLLNAAQFTPAP